MTDDLTVDVVVLGGGMGGTTAAYVAAKVGLRVALIEKASALGGSALLSGTHVWTATSAEQLAERAPTGDRDLQRTLIENFPRLTSLIRESGVEVSEDLQVLYGRGNRFDIVNYLHRVSAAVTKADGVVALGTETVSLLSEHDQVVGVTVRDADGLSDIRCRAVVLATGGFQGDRHRMETYMGERAHRLMLRSNPHSTGDGLRLALNVGADIAGDMATFYGHLIASPIPEFRPSEFVRNAFIYSDRGLLVNRGGERFAQEWLGDHLNTQRVAEQDQGRAVLVFDERIRRDSSRAPVVKGTEAVDTFEEAAEVGARTATADTLEELADKLVAWGFERPDLESLARQHQVGAAAAGVDAVVREGPFYAVEVRPGITFTEGGIRIDSAARVLRPNGEPIAGLYAAGADAGGVFDGGYAGGLAYAGTFAMLAAEHAIAAQSFGSPR